MLCLPGGECGGEIIGRECRALTPLCRYSRIVSLQRATAADCVQRVQPLAQPGTYGDAAQSRKEPERESASTSVPPSHSVRPLRRHQSVRAERPKRGETLRTEKSTRKLQRTTVQRIGQVLHLGAASDRRAAHVELSVNLEVKASGEIGAMLFAISQ